jgi:ankyrin repeat protein
MLIPVPRHPLSDAARSRYCREHRQYPEEVRQAVKDEQSWTALHRAAQKGDVQEVERLVNAGADKEAQCLSGKTPLHFAAVGGHVDMLPFLITPTTLMATDNKHRTPLHWAIEANQAEAAAVLVAAGAPLGAPNPGAESAWERPVTPMALAIDCLLKNGEWSSQLAMQLVDAVQAVLAKPETSAETARVWKQRLTSGLHTAAAVGCPDLVTKLLQAGADKDFITPRTGDGRFGRSALGHAAAAGHGQLVPLLATPFNINTADATGSTPLQLAAKKGYRKTTAALLAAGATPTAVDNTGQGILTAAAVKGGTQVVRLLLEALAKGYAQQQQPDHAGLLQLLVAAGLPLAGCTIRCSGFLGAVLDVLGPGVTGEVCQAVQERLQAALAAGEPPKHTPFNSFSKDRWCAAPQVSHLAEGLLLGWLRAVERLHGVPQPLGASLQRLEPGVEAAGQQQQDKDEKGEQEGGGEPEQQEEWHKRLEQLVADAASAAATAGQEEKALSVMWEAARLVQCHMAAERVDLQQYSDPCHTELDCGEFLCDSLPLVGGPDHQPHSWSYMDMAPLLGRLMHQGMVQAARARVQGSGSSSGTSSSSGAQALAPDKERAARSFHPHGVYTTFLAAWVEARRQLQLQMAVKAAQQQQQQQDEAEEAELLCDLLAILQQADGAGEVVAG